MSLRDEMNQQADEYGDSPKSSFFKFEKTGNYRMRVMAKPYAIATHFFGAGNPSVVCVGKDKGCPFHGENASKDENGNEKKASVKFITYIIDREDGQIRLAELPWSVLSRIADFEEDDDYKFSGYPMPYDIKVKYDKENKDPKSIYKTEASPKMEAVTPEETDQFAKAMAKLTPEDFVTKRKDRQLTKVDKSEIEYPKEESDPESIPF